tara:strand:- start:315 stop:488 length:174 start_codon:yes stop_codon:yes gene_type:complete
MDKSLSKINGKLPNKLNDTQKETTIRKPSLIFISDKLVVLKFGKNRIDPIRKVMIIE